MKLQSTRVWAVLFTAAVLVSGFIVPVQPLFAQSITISQVDASRLLLNQRVDLYVSITDPAGEPLGAASADAFRVMEAPSASADSSALPGEFLPVKEIFSVEQAPHKEEGIHITLLIDNSGSMYDTIGGRETEDPSEMRTSAARNAIRSFIGSTFHPADTIALASFNTNLLVHSEDVADPSGLSGLLDEISRPAAQDAYTELYHALVEAAPPGAGRSGRKVVVVLSDGENYPYYTYSGNEHPQYGSELRSSDEVLDHYQREGISLYAVNFGGDRDRNLAEMAIESGGSSYDAWNEEDLSNIYRDIRRKIDSEYRIRYRAGMFPSERTFVKVIYRDGGREREARRFYYTSTMFGIPVLPYPYWILLAIPCALLLWGLLFFIRYRKIHRSAALQVLDPGYGTKVSSATVLLDQGKTVIGGGERADLTISGRGSGGEQEVTILYNESDKSYTVASSSYGAGSVTVVNNRPLKGPRKLSGGDVLNIDGTTIVFEEPDA
jgi:Ca-activated chloride channel homolog